MKFMMVSNVFLFFPVVAAIWAHEWLYLLFALGISIFSTAYHYLKENNSTNQRLVSIIKKFDWLFAAGSYIYMYYFIFTKSAHSLQIILTVALTLTVIFFWYGWKVGNYQKIHPWFHFFAGIISTIIVLSK